MSTTTTPTLRESVEQMHQLAARMAAAMTGALADLDHLDDEQFCALVLAGIKPGSPPLVDMLQAAAQHQHALTLATFDLAIGIQKRAQKIASR